MNVMKHYQINREERHFGFLFLSAVISNHAFRKELFALINARTSLKLNDQEFDIYAEVAIYRDIWSHFGDHKKYTKKIHSDRLRVLIAILETMGIDSSIVNKEDLFWTGEIDKSKLWFPGKWSKTKIDEVQTQRNIKENRLLRCRWLCNAKPDILIHSENDVLFIEVKVESGMGSNEQGYDQIQTQKDIITVGAKIIDWIHDGRVKRINLSHLTGDEDITWKDVIEIYKKTKASSDVGADMLERHFQYLPKGNRLLEAPMDSQ